MIVMSYRVRTRILLTTLSALLLSIPAHAQGTIADYQRAMGLREKYQGLAINVPEPAVWIEKQPKFWYRKSVKGGNEFVLVDAATQAKTPAFDHAKLAERLNGMIKPEKPYTPATLPFNTFSYADGTSAIEFAVNNTPYRCSLSDYSCRVDEGGGRGGRGGGRGGRGGRRGIPGPVRPEFDINGGEAKKSPDGKLEALIQNYNVAIRETGKSDVTLLSTDGSEGGYYDLDSLAWSPDSKKIIVYKVKPGFRRYVHYIESSPEDQLQPKHSFLQYAKPGDVLDVERPVLFHVDTKQQIVVDPALFPNAYDVTRLVWRKDSSAATFEYNERGHQIYRVIEVNGDSGAARAVVTEEAKTFFCYSGKKYRFDVQDGKEIIWMSERDGWNHLYLYDGQSGRMKTQITNGNWVVRNVIKVDEDKRQIWFSASGMYPGKDPYFVHYYRINFDGTGLTTLTGADANHVANFSTDMEYYVDTYSRVDAPHVSELRRGDGTLVAKIESGDISELKKAGWKPPEVFTSMARDGKTDILGVIYRPTNFDPANKYPVIENIYAGPQGSFVPKSFSAFNAMQATAELGFIVVQIDGMGTNNRSKAFHDVAWKNLKDAGFEDRILWHKAVAAKYPYYDITRVGIYGTSAGGQNSLGALLFHPDFYDAAFTAAGCHDNRMDKIWWNEQWMGWPIGPEYAASSNVDNAYRLQGKVLLVVGEMDNNVDPSSTYQVVNQLIEHNKDFDLLVIPGAGHGAGGAYGDHKRYDFFVRHLLGVKPPEWSELAKATSSTTTQQRDE
jgi:dipeptidyl aminopeptidase/acylaminoacyl peptidase